MAIIVCDDNNINHLREQYPNGLHFVVGDTHGEWKSLEALMSKIQFDPKIDHVYFVGDYNGGGNVVQLMNYISNYYQADYQHPGFHLIRGNHERELGPMYTLYNMPDIIVIRGKQMNYFIVHAGMIKSVFDFINKDLMENSEQTVFAYRLAEQTVCYDAPFREIIWSRRGLYSQGNHYSRWPSLESLTDNHACIIHGHTPYCYLTKENYFTYGRQSLFWQNQRVFFSEDLQSFDIDSNIKGRFNNGEGHRGLSCVCIEVLEEVASKNNGVLTIDGLCNAQNGVFSVDYIPYWSCENTGDLYRLLKAEPQMKIISTDIARNPIFNT